MEHIKETWEQDVYIANDGQRFRDKNECERHEQDREDYRLLSQLSEMKLKIPFLYENGYVEKTWYLISNISERDAVIRKYTKRWQYTVINNSQSGKPTDLKVGDWFARGRIYDDGERNRVGIWVLSHIYEKMNKFVKDLDKITVKGQV